ncbi:ABC transporter permease [Actinokineospora auranticolor]|uniref:Uncharacterized protein n=1 Tax=Actinokineospora auranticolor TaxID=155976 RepID=A0A2S6GKJ9_9PSEU|nr:ABC transporter permease [Actinokineospora auranticolor]PPK65762.1 hypothetical protein CLV40_11221 [Actinokineospora auranticolor]
MTSAYPITVDALVERVKARAVELGQVPTRNRIKTEFRVGAPKANAVLAELEATGFDPAVRRLHTVSPTDPAPEDEPGPENEPAEPGRGQGEPVTADPDEPVTSPVTEAPWAPLVADDTGAARVACAEVTAPVDPGPTAAPQPGPVPAEAGQKPWWSRGRSHSLPLLVIAAGAFVAIWGGWVGLGEKAGFGLVRLLPGIADEFVINSAITLPLGMEAYAAFALRVWLTSSRAAKGRGFAKWSAIAALILGGLGQVAYHLMEAAGITVAPWWITTFVSCLPVAVLGCAAALLHLWRQDIDGSDRR